MVQLEVYEGKQSNDDSETVSPSFEWTQLTFPSKLFFCRAKYAELGNAGSHNLIFAAANPLLAEKEEAKAVLTLFLKKRCLSKVVEARTVDKSALFIDHLVSRLHSVHKNRYLGGSRQELTTLEIRDALNPYLETLYEEFGDILVDVVENFPNPATEIRSTENLSTPSLEEEPVVPVSAPITTLNSKKLKALARLTDDGLTGKPPPHIVYLTELGMDMEVIKEVTQKFPKFAYYSLDRNIKPFVEFLLDLGIPKSDIPSILRKRPQLCGVRQMEKLLIPTITYLKNLGMDKKQLAKAIFRFPGLLTCSRQKLESTIDLLYELGLPAENLCKVLTRGPQILGFSVETLKARAKYFHSIGVDVGHLLSRHPQIFFLNIETNLKPLTEFFLERGFSTADIASMISKFGVLYNLSLSNNIIPKWEFFLTMCYSKSELVKYPQYFAYSLELRIKPRYAIMREIGVTFSLGWLLALSDEVYEGKRCNVDSETVSPSFDWTQLTFPNKLFFCRAKYAELGNAGSHNLIFAPANPLVTEKEEAKAVLTLFLKKRGQELTTLEIRDALNPYLETLYEEFGDSLVDVVENFPNPPTEVRSTENLSIPSLEEEPVVPVSAPITTLNSKKLKALARLTDDGLTGKPPPHIVYLTELGMDMEVIKEVTQKFPKFAYYSLDRNIKPMVEFLLDLGIPKSDIPTILSKRPQLCGVRQMEKLLIPTLTYLKNLGMDKKQLIKAICRFPALLACSRQKLESTIDLLYELGLPAENLGKVLTRGPQILGLSVETLKARAKYFHSLGVDVGSLLYRYPTIFALNIETNLKPLTEFFLERGFSTSDIASMISRFGSLCNLSLSNNIMPKWEFFLTMCYSKSELVKYPQYFGYSLEMRIKPRTQLTFPNKLFFCRAKYAESGNTGSHNLIFAPANPLVTEKEEAKAVLTLFLKKRGLSNAVAARTVDKSALFIDHLVSRIHFDHKNRYPGTELTTLEIRDALNPYLETLYEEFGDSLVDVVENFPNPPTEVRSTENLSIPSLEEEPVVPVSAPITTLNSKKLKALTRLTDDGLTGKLPPHIVYLTELGMDMDVIKEVTLKFPKFVYYSLDRNIKPCVEFLLDLGIPKSDIPTILSKRPQLCGVRQMEKLVIPSITYLKNLGMDKEQLTKAICRFPALLTCSRQKLESTIDLLYELGLPAEKLCKVLTRGPQILGLSVETLKARAKYFHSIGVDVGRLLCGHPQIFCLNIETNLKPLTEFFLERGFSTADIASMISKFGVLYYLSLSNNIMPKWEFFLTMCYSKSELVKYPQYFGYSLELRIKPRYAIMREIGVTFSLGWLLALSDGDFDEVLKRKMEKHVG
ncbi:hypothetical protein RHSIM_Rhsim08G0044500 [Rhododendron simsii]|uniref:Uncharacterized protein n=1 Tax=Rhododendron simsii TaxID=118357 RepID=A0A834GKR8_RHOSS|nr:hypothetical protein RHSIM_Rhsim08G0044500 [Rhododendron simsii]